MKKVVKITSTVLLVFLAIMAGTVVYFVFQAKGDIEKVPSIFGYKPLTILSNSMQPAFNAGDIILINTEIEPQVNDVITYKHPDGMLITHRAIDTVEENGKTLFVAQGDNNNVKDDVLIPREDILGIQKAIVPGAGYIAKFVSGPIGFFLLVAVPLLIVLIIEIFQRLGIIGNRKEEQIQG
ncbi:signal peptidase I [Bacillus luteolus]|uniref:Signal peptidase I n=1 Tax=Litchfieldia luteola TaxID=682179 RepID=A0ABR9QHG7_9BACI|nr:signal peptidase I [Cytobacillus luteolus]MBE4907938.1 signal peptidase I [Cytobacillus luteolus]MBP1942717.1 signal peptidase [Cytobacillus luteolus]